MNPLRVFRALPSLLAAAALLVSPIFAQDPPKPPAPPSDPAANMAMPQPGPEHARLMELVGVWETSGKFYMPGAPPTDAKGTETVAALGGFWITSRYEGEFGGAPFTGHGVTGFDQLKGKYVSFWVDTMSSTPMLMQGSFDAKTQTLMLMGDAPDMSGKMATWVERLVLKDKDTHSFTMHVKDEKGVEQLAMEITYRRKA